MSDDLIALLAYPAAILLAAIAFMLIFIGPIRRKIESMSRAGFGKGSAEFQLLEQGAANSQQKKPSNVGGDTGVLPPTDNAVPSTHNDLPPPSDVLAPIEAEINQAIEQAKKSPATIQAMLVRAVATWRVLRGHEVNYRLIVGGQLQLLLEANSATPPTVERARSIYDAQAAAWPLVYEHFTFDTWTSWPQNAGLLEIENRGTQPNVFKVTLLGRDFLHYLVQTGLTIGKHG